MRVTVRRNTDCPIESSSRDCAKSANEDEAAPRTGGGADEAQQISVAATACLAYAGTRAPLIGGRSFSQYPLRQCANSDDADRRVLVYFAGFAEYVYCHGPTLRTRPSLTTKHAV